MTKRKNNELEQIKFFVAELINKEQDKHSKLIADLRQDLDGSDEFDKTVKILAKVYEAKIKMLEKVYKKIQDLE